MRNTTPKDELPEDVVRDYLPTGKLFQMRVVGDVLQLRVDGEWVEDVTPPLTRERLVALAKAYPDRYWPRALAYYDEQVARQKRLPEGGRRDTIGEYTVNWGELPKPSYIPPNAPWCWVTDGLGRQVGAWAEVFTIDGRLLIKMQSEKIQYIWEPRGPNADWRGRIADQQAASVCRALWTRCVVDDKGRVWEMVWEQPPEADDDDDPVIAFGRSGDDLVPLDVLLRFITDPTQRAIVRAFVEHGEKKDPSCVTENPPLRGGEETQPTAQGDLGSDTAVPTEADEQSSSVGVEPLIACRACGGDGYAGTANLSNTRYGVCYLCKGSGYKSHPKQDTPPPEPEPPFSGTTFDLQAAAVARLELALSKAESERDTVLARAKRAEVDAELLRASAKTFQAAEKEALARAEKAERERDDYSRRIEAAFERENASKARAEKAEGDCQAALKAWHREEETVREMRRERNEAQARVRELEAKLQGTQEELDKFTGAFERELKRADQVTAELGKVAAQRDRAWDTNEILKEQMEAMASDARKLSDDFAGLLEDNAKEAVRTKVDTKPRPACIPDGVTEWTTLPESGLACWKSDDEVCCIEDRAQPDTGPFEIVEINTYSNVFAVRRWQKEFEAAISPANFSAARRFMGWE